MYSLNFDLAYQAYPTTQIVVTYPRGILITGTPTITVSQASNTSLVSWNASTVVFNANFNMFLPQSTQVTLNLTGPSIAPRSALINLIF